MRELIHLLTMVAFAVHAVVGCCLHHHHDSSLQGSDSVSHIQPFACKHVCSHQHDAAQPGDEQSDRKSPEERPCDESTCAFQAEPCFRMSEILNWLRTDTLFAASLTTSPANHTSEKLLVAPRLVKSVFLDAASLRATLQTWII